MKPTPLIRETIETTQRNQLLDVTRRVEHHVERVGLMDGMAIIYSPHTTSAVTINENADPDVKSDLLAKLSHLAPKEDEFYEHLEGNSDGHVKSSLVGASTTVLVEGGKLMLGRWQGIYFCEFDGPRERQLWIKLVSFS